MKWLALPLLAVALAACSTAPKKSPSPSTGGITRPSPATPSPGIAGKVMAQADGILIIRWRLGSSELDSGLRADDRDSQAEFLVAAKDLLAGNPGKSEEATT